MPLWWLGPLRRKVRGSISVGIKGIRGSRLTIRCRNEVIFLMFDNGGEETEAKKRNPRYRARRWVVERTNSWLNRFRKLLVRYEKTAASHEGLLELACALITFRQTIVIHG
jgi:hypothetical protein